MKKLYILALVIFGFSMNGFGQIRVSRTVPIRGYQPQMRGMILVPMRAPLRTLMPTRPIYYCGQCPAIFINAQNVNIYQNDGIREYPSSSSITQAPPIRYARNQEEPTYNRATDNYGQRIQSIEERLSSLEALAAQIKQKLDNSSNAASTSNDYNQRLVRLEEQMQALRDVLVELRNYLASKK